MNKIDYVKVIKDAGLNIIAVLKFSELLDTSRAHLIKQNIKLQENSSLIIFASGGTTLWRNLPRPIILEKDPIDSYAIKKMHDFITHYKLEKTEILFPNKKYLLPLQSLGREASIACESFLGIDINQEFGPWFSYRGVILLENETIDIDAIPKSQSVCLTCIDRPCINACPASAIKTIHKFDSRKCLNFRLSTKTKCEDTCLSREACSYKTEHKYTREQIHYHMSQNLLTQHLKQHVDNRN